MTQVILFQIKITLYTHKHRIQDKHIYVHNRQTYKSWVVENHKMIPHVRCSHIYTKILVPQMIKSRKLVISNTV